MRTTTVARATTQRQVLSAGAADVVAVLVFAFVGRQSHEEATSIAGLGRTALPFLLGLVVGWLVLRAWQHPLSPLRTGVPLALITVTAGMLARWATDQGTALPFVIVATTFLLMVLVGWRAVTSFVRRRRRYGDG